MHHLSLLSAKFDWTLVGLFIWTICKGICPLERAVMIASYNTLWEFFKVRGKKPHKRIFNHEINKHDRNAE